MKLFYWIAVSAFWIDTSVMGSPTPESVQPSLPERCVMGPAYQRLGNAVLEDRAVSDPSFNPSEQPQNRGIESYPKDPNLTGNEEKALQTELKVFWMVFHRGPNSGKGKQWSPQMRDHCAVGFDAGFWFPFPSQATYQIREQVKEAYEYGFLGLPLDHYDETLKTYHTYGQKMRRSKSMNWEASQLYLECLEEGIGKRTSRTAKENPESVDGLYRGWMYGFAIRGCSQKLQKEWEEATKDMPEPRQLPDLKQRSEWLTTCIERARQHRMLMGCSPNHPPLDLPSKILKLERQMTNGLSDAKQAMAGEVAGSSKGFTENVQAAMSNPRVFPIPKMQFGAFKAAPAWARVL
ncbi:MAG: hypothetical protein M1823_005884 [Watsoniomyces obsoletus]|nr:MAG: hypothetical protein M1823_005884 [Watsoniomyces obsoletus]